jgi:DnaK suppressor protein
VEKSLNPDRAELAQEYDQRQRLTAQLQKDKDQLECVEAALERIEAGVFGICLLCGEPIPAQRLEALPWAELCISCREKQERKLY